MPITEKQMSSAEITPFPTCRIIKNTCDAAPGSLPERTVTIEEYHQFGGLVLVREQGIPEIENSMPLDVIFLRDWQHRDGA